LAYFTAHAQKRYLGASGQKSDATIRSSDVDFT